MRRYVINFENVAVSAAQDLIQVKGATGKMLLVRRAWWGATDTSVPTSQMVRTQCRFLGATVTDGSGGSSPTVQKIDPGDAAASLTAKANNATQATSSGTVLVLCTSGDHLYNGFDRRWERENAPAIGPSESFTFELLSAVSGTVHLSGGVEVEEIGG